MSYPTPTTPLPWHYGMTLVTADCDYVVHAANAFPHLVAALEATLLMLTKAPGHRDMIAHALAIARGEMQP